MWTWNSMTIGAIALMSTSACSSTTDDAVSRTGPPDGPRGAEDAGRLDLDGGHDADAALDVGGCSGSSVLPDAVIGDHVAADGSEHWIRVTPRATTYTRVPAGAPTPSIPPTLHRVTKVCGDQRAFIAAGADGRYTRVDWSADASGLRFCIAAVDVADAASAIAAPSTDASAATTGCLGRPWIVLARLGDGGR